MKVSQRVLSRAEQEDLIIDFFRALACVKNPTEAARVLSDLLTSGELTMLSKRLAIARRLLAGQNYMEIEKSLKVGTSTIARVNIWLQEAGEGFRLVANRVLPPNKGKKSKLSLGVTGLTGFKRRYPQYFWPEKFLEQIVKAADQKQRRQLRAIIQQSKQKNILLKQFNLILNNKLV